MIVPVLLYVVGAADFTSESAGFWLAVTVAVASFEVTGLPPKVVAAVALLVIEPASRSPWVIVWVAVQLVVPSGATGPVPQGLIVPCLSSVTVKGPARVTLPLFVSV